ncbi:MAG: helix-turn-helix domain-containing protein, partial [Chloroflexi bacterium]|nr:helix-turn-helix domain-containing protein [Chloroflexota bacterium]
MTLDDAFRKLRIPREYLRGLEEGTLESLPEMCYAVGFLRTYCLYLGLDPEPYVDCLRECATVQTASRRTGLRHGDGSLAVCMQDLYAWGALS